MASFLATYVNASGGERTYRVEAPDLSSAKKILRRRGIKATSLQQTKTAGKNNPNSSASNPETGLQKLLKADLGAAFEKPPGVKDKAVFASKLSALVDAGVPIVRGLDIMASQQKLPMFKKALTQISLDVNEGSALSDSMRRWPKVFDPLSLAMVEAGEVGGVLDDTLQRLAKLLEDTARIRNQIKGAMGYPVAVFVIALLVFLGMTIFLIPTFANIFDQLGAELPLFTQLMVDLSSFLRSPSSLYIVGAIILMVVTINRFYATQKGRRIIDRGLLKLPLFGDLIMKTATAQFCRIYSSLTRAGVPILLSLEIASDTAGNSIVSDAILSSRNLVQEGVLLSEALTKENVLPEMALSMLAIGEETGEMDRMLSKVADFYEDEVAAVVKVLTSMLEPAMIVIVGGMVGAILIAMYLPMFTVFNKIR